MKKTAFKRQPCRACAKTTPKQNTKSLQYNKADGGGVDLEGMTPTEYINKVFDKLMVQFADDNDANTLSVSKVSNYDITPQQFLDLHLTYGFPNAEDTEGIVIVGRNPLDVLNDLLLQNPQYMNSSSSSRGVPSKCKCGSTSALLHPCDCQDVWGIITCFGWCVVPGTGGTSIDGVNIDYGCYSEDVMPCF